MLLQSTFLYRGDVVLTRSSNWVSSVILWATRDKDEEPSYVNHVGIISSDGPANFSLITEAISTGVVERPFLSAYKRGKESPYVAIFRPLNMDEAELALVAATAKSRVGQKYGYAKLLYHLWYKITGQTTLFNTQIDKYPICSYLVASAFSAVSRDFGVSVGRATPDDIWDFVLRNPDKYAMIHSLGVL